MQDNIRLTFVFLLLLSLAFSTKAQEFIPIIPKPHTYQKQSGSFKLSKTTSVINTPTNAKIAWYLKNEILRHTGIALSSNTQSTSTITFSIVPEKKMTNYAYKLVMLDNKINIEAANDEGLFMGAISLLQLIRQAPIVANHINLPNWNIADKPQFAWRGFMLDESRHFFGTEKVKQLLDWMAFYKLNRFHWHLTDEPGWRIEIKKYPLLTLVGGIGNFVEENAPAKYYTQEQIKEIVAYAAERFITIIPEIDMPGHATAANRAYPQHSGGGSEKHPEFTFHPGKESTYQYLSNILREVNTLFPSGLIHIGGDEVSFGNQLWNSLPEVKQLMQKEKLNDLKDLERYFIKRMSDTLISINSKTLAWDEVVDFKLRKDSTIIFWWRHDKPEQLNGAINNGYQVIICPRLPFYYDFVQDSTHNYGRKWEAKFNSLSSIYNYNFPTIDSKKSNQILGVQANLWTETVENTSRLDYLVFPRISALAEVAWSSPSARTDFDGFMQRLKYQLPLYDEAGLYYYNHFKPNHHPEPVKTKKKKLRFNTEN